MSASPRKRPFTSHDAVRREGPEADIAGYRAHVRESRFFGIGTRTFGSIIEAAALYSLMAFRVRRDQSGVFRFLSRV